MEERHFRVTLLTDLVLSRTTATEQANVAGLDYIPGSSFLGIVAQQLYARAAHARARALVHSSAVSFGDATLLIDGTRAYPVPFAWFVEKGQTPTDGKVWLYTHAFEVLFKGDKQYQQQRNGFVTSDGKYVSRLPKTFTLRSARDYERRKAADKQMFGLEALAAGLTFAFSVRAQSGDQLDVITSLLEGEQRLGKSCSAEFGKVRIEKLASHASDPVYQPPSLRGYLIVYAESDLCLYDADGLPTLFPDASHFGVNGQVDFSRSQIRTRSFSLWNTKRSAITNRRDCIQRGSVIAIRLNEEIDTEKLPHEIGGYRNEGLGRIQYNPAFLKGDRDGKLDLPIKPYRLEVGLSRPTLPEGEREKVEVMFEVLRKKQQQARQEIHMLIALRDFIQNKEKVFKSITPSQWGLVREKAMLAESLVKLEEELLDEEKGILLTGVRAPLWREVVVKDQSPAKVLKEELEKRRKEQLPPVYVALLASEMAKRSRAAMSQRSGEVQ